MRVKDAVTDGVAVLDCDCVGETERDGVRDGDPEGVTKLDGDRDGVNDGDCDRDGVND